MGPGPVTQIDGVPLHLTKVAFGVASLEAFVARWAAREGDPPYELGTRYLPKRWEEIAGQGSLFWILKHQLVARSEILRFEEAPGGQTHIVVSTRLIDVRPKPKRAHQGWRYLEDKDAPQDLAEGEVAETMPGKLAADLARLGLV